MPSCSRTAWMAAFFALGLSVLGVAPMDESANAQSAAKPTTTASGLQIIDTKPKAHCVFVDASNKHVYVPVLGADYVMQFKFDASTLMDTFDGRTARSEGRGG